MLYIYISIYIFIYSVFSSASSFCWHLFTKWNAISTYFRSGLLSSLVILQLEYSNVRNGITNCRGGTLWRGQCDNNEVTKQASQNIGNSREIARWSETRDFGQKRVGPNDFSLYLLLRRSLFSYYMCLIVIWRCDF